MSIKLTAYKFIIDNKIKNFSINLEQLIEIVRKNGWEIFSFKQNLALIKELGLQEKTKNTLGFTYTFKTISDNKKILTKSIIFYKDELTLKEKYFVILHEIGHIILNHIYNSSVLEKSTNSIYLDENLDLEAESDLFACEVLAPSCILKKLNLTNFNDIKAHTLIPDEYINKYLLEIHKINTNNQNELDLKVKKVYFKYILKFNFCKKYNIIKTFALISVILVCTFTFFIIKNNSKEDTISPIISYLKENDIEVYVTRTGAKYHTQDCYHLKNTVAIKIEYEDLIDSIYTPCKICFGSNFLN